MNEQPNKIGVYQLNGKFVVRDATRVGEPILTDDGRHADNSLWEDMRFFGMSLADAEALAEHLHK